MENPETILEPYFQQVEQSNPPSFGSLIQKYMLSIDTDPTGNEVVCLTALLLTLYPAEFKEALNVKLRDLGFTAFDLAAGGTA